MPIAFWTSYFYPRSPCGERRELVASDADADDFYPRSPCGERPLHLLRVNISQTISIHALLAESDPYLKESDFWILIFLSTLSLRRATLTRSTLPAATWYFYPRSPCGERRMAQGVVRPQHYFYPRSPCGERLRRVERRRNGIHISIHALLAESDFPKPTPQKQP